MMDIFIEMISYPFMVRAIIVGCLVSLCASLLGTSLVLKRYSMIGDGLSHVGFAARLKNGKVLNLLAPEDLKKEYLSTIGYGFIMGVLNNYEATNPFISSTTDAFNRLKPGFEAPVCIVTSLSLIHI